MGPPTLAEKLEYTESFSVCKGMESVFPLPLFFLSESKVYFVKPCIVCLAQYVAKVGAKTMFLIKLK